MILAHALLKIDIREKLPRPLVGSPHRSPRRMPSSRESCPLPKRHRVLQQPASSVTLSSRWPRLGGLRQLGRRRKLIASIISRGAFKAASLLGAFVLTLHSGIGTHPC